MFFRYVAGIEPKEDKKAFAIGRAYHRGLEVWRLNGYQDVDQAIAAAASMFYEETCTFLPQNEIKTCISQIRAYLGSYPWRFDQGSVEAEVPAFPGDDGEVGFIDLIWKDSDDKRWVVEDKTVGQFVDAGAFFYALNMEDQILTYALAMLDYGTPVEGVLYRQVLKTRTSQKKCETEDQYEDRIFQEYRDNNGKYYRQFKVLTPPEKLEAWRRHKDRNNLGILSFFDVYVLDEWPYNPDNCIGPYGPCEYVNLCYERRDNKSLYRPNGKNPLDGGKFMEQIFIKKGTQDVASTEENGSRQEAVPTV